MEIRDITVTTARSLDQARRNLRSLVLGEIALAMDRIFAEGEINSVEEELQISDVDALK